MRSADEIFGPQAVIAAEKGLLFQTWTKVRGPCFLLPLEREDLFLNIKIIKCAQDAWWNHKFCRNSYFYKENSNLITT